MKRYAQRERSAAPSTPATAAVGIDLAKRTLAACLRLTSGKSYQRQFANDLAGFQALVAWLAHYTPLPVPVCLEATGTYGEALAVYLHEQGYAVSVVNPHRIVHYARSQGTRHKTDPVDARVIAEFCAKEQPPRWTPPAAHYRYLQALLRHQETLEQDQQRERNRLQSAEHPPLCANRWKPGWPNWKRP
jgi:transposase